ncbi:amidohydrolase family protein [Bordetella tumulicola]|uniref:amidohydrolase family protein n=1 Tax=Bordetella tumulicola TaxID=1649133 RepID=UPI0039F0D2E6
MLITDTQVHFWEAHRADQPWPAEEIGKKTFVAVPGARPHREAPLLAEEFLPIMNAAGVARAIIVPPSPVGDSNITALREAQRHPSRLAIMGRFNPDADDACSRLEQWLEQPQMLGIRMTFHKPKWRGWLEPGVLDWYWSACERMGIALMLFVPGAVDKIAPIAQRYPGLTIVLDHMARESQLRDDACFADLDRLLALARLPNVYVKMSAAPCYSSEPYPFQNIQPYLRRIYDAFGPRRSMWGSDFTRLPCTYQECVDHFRLALNFIDPEDLEWVMGKTAAQVLRWPEAAALRG